MKVYKAKFGESKLGWVVLIHGLGEHSGRYERLIRMLNDAGFAVYTFDWPGHGRSPGRRGHTSVEEAMEIIDSIIEELNEKPFLFGHSLGGLAVIRYAETRADKVRGVVASSPALARSPKTPSFMVALAKFLGKIAPGITMSNGLDPKLLSRNPEAVRRYINDPLVHDRISARLGRSIFENMELAHREAKRINVPILLIVGTGDVITPPEGSRRLFKELTVEDREIREFEGAYHEIFEDPEWADEFHEVIVRWFVEHSRSTASEDDADEDGGAGGV